MRKRITKRKSKLLKGYNNGDPKDVRKRNYIKEHMDEKIEMYKRRKQ